MLSIVITAESIIILILKKNQMWDKFTGSFELDSKFADFQKFGETKVEDFWSIEKIGLKQLVLTKTYLVLLEEEILTDSLYWW